MRIEDAKGKQLESDDDGAGDENARLFFTPSATGVYRIIATSHEDGGLGAYVLGVQEMR